MGTKYSKIYTGNFIIVQRIVHNLEKKGIAPIVKDETESARLAGFGSSVYGLQEIYVNASEKTIAESIVSALLSKL